MSKQNLLDQQPLKGIATESKQPTGLLDRLPSSWVPYVVLIRLHKPVGILNIYFPYLFGCLLGACVSQKPVEPQALFLAALQMLLGAFILRSMGCAFNDIVDADIDARTARCKSRPMACGAISTKNAYAFTFTLLLIWCCIIYQTTNTAACLYAIPVPFMAALYPYGKRFTSFPQLILGVTLALGILVGAAQLNLNFGVTFLETGLHAHDWALVCLFASYVVFALIHDTIYGFQDLKDDRKNGALSMSVLFADSSSILFLGLSFIQVVTLIAVGIFESFGIGYFVIACGGVGFVLAAMMVKLDTESPRSCWTWFQVVSLGFGHLVALGLLWQYAVDT